MIKSALTVLAVAGARLFAQGGEPVATVDGQAIERHAFDHWLTISARSAMTVEPDPANGHRRCIAEKRKSASGKRRSVTDSRLKAECEQDYAQLRDQVMQLLISFKWIEGEAAALGVTVTEAEVDAAFEDQKRQSFPKDADFKKFLRESGQTRDDILQRVRLDLMSDAIRAKVVAGHDQISDQAIEQFYTENRARFVEPEMRDLRIVMTKRKAEAARARAALARGATWRAVTKRYSIDATSRRRAGTVVDVEKGTLERPLDKAVFGAAKGRLVGPVRTDYGYYVLTVTKVEPARQLTLEEVRDVIEQTLASQAEQAALDAFVQDFTARWREKTVCAKGFRTTDCRNGPKTDPVRTR